MTRLRLLFLILAGAAAIGAIVLMGLAHADMAQMRTLRPSFNFDGIIAFGCGVLIAAGLIVLIGLWKVLAFSPAHADRDLKVWIWVLWTVFLGLHLPFGLSDAMDAWINAAGEQTPGYALRQRVFSSDFAVMTLILCWPLPVICLLRRYRHKFAKLSIRNT